MLVFWVWWWFDGLFVGWVVLVFGGEAPRCGLFVCIVLYFCLVCVVGLVLGYDVLVARIGLCWVSWYVS